MKSRVRNVFDTIVASVVIVSVMTLKKSSNVMFERASTIVY